MKRNKIIYDRWLRMLFLSFALLTGGGVGMAWGQTDTEKPVINLVYSKNHDNVHVEEKTIYVDPNKSRVLSIPVLNVNTRKQGDDSYNWFVHWYVENSSSNTNIGTIQHSSFSIDNNYAGNRGGLIANETPGIKNKTYTTTDNFAKVKNTNGLIWSKRLTMSSSSNSGIDLKGLGIDASTIAYQLPSNYTDGDIVYCDVSVYQDGVWSASTSDSNIKGTYTEPTLLKRYKYVIKKAEECPSYNKKDTTFYIEFPSEAPAINLSMPYSPDNYFWKDENKVHQGAEFEYQINNSDFQKFHLTTKKATLDKQQTQRIIIDDELKNKDFTINIRAICNETPSHESEIIATFNFHPIENAKFMMESEFDNIDKQNNDRWPRGNTQKYQQIGHVSFDQSSEDELPTEIKHGDNMSDKPLGSFNQSETTYGFIYKNSMSLKDDRTYCYTSYPGMYGLFRSANVDKISKHNTICSTDQDVNRYYKWATVQIDNAYSYDHHNYPNSCLYDRTYSVTKEKGEEKKRYGYFYYVDATDEPGTLVSIPIDGTICGNTELTVTGWLADMTRPGCDAWTTGLPLPLAPNLNVILKGVDDKGKPVVIHRFTTGDALTNYINNTLTLPNGSPGKSTDPNKDKYNTYLMQWQQFHYKFVVSEEKFEGCEPGQFYLEVQNNEPHTDGADYAIDDIRIFKTIPDVKVIQSGNPCDEEIKTVKFKSNYNMLLKNFGLTAGEPIDQSIATPLSYEDYMALPETHLLKKYFTNKNENEIKETLKYFTTIYYAIYNAKEDKGEIVPTGDPIQIEYDGQEKTYYRVSYLSTRIEDMAWANESSSSSFYNTNDGYITSTNVSINGELTANTTYIARVSKAPISGECETCSFYNSFVLEGVGDRIEVTQDGKAVDITKASPNNTYTITGILKYNSDPNSDELISVENPIFDWYLGTWDEFVKPGTISVGNKSYSIMEALQVAFHNDGEDATNEISIALKNKLGEYNGETNKDGKLVLGTSSFEFNMTSEKQWGVMFPRAKQNNLPEGAVICSDPHEFLLGGTPPTIEPGDPDVPDPEDPDPDDPEDPDPKDPDDPDKPDENPFDGSHVRSVRVGLVQILDMQTNEGTLRIPIHARTSLKNEKFAKQDGENKSDIIVYKTSDKAWNLNTEAVATLEKLVDENQKAGWRTNYFTVKFTEKAKKFKEGFWYMVGIPYKVIDTDNNNNDVYVDRKFMLTLKIVPEYVTWVGSINGMHNWNNDGPSHWRRSKNSELYMGTDDEQTGAQVNGTHNEAYTPMRFTKVTIYGNKENKPYSAYPHLYELKKQGQYPILQMATTNEIGAATKNIEYDLLADPDYEKELWGEESTGELALKDHDYACVRFYGNTCDEIYIKPESEILHTECLTYNKAHVDYEMAPNRWYMLASPLKGVVSGDMYLPTGTGTPKVGSYARQETPAFGEVKYDNTNYTRWKPAVYMRGWDKAKATVVRPDGTKPNYGITSSWSNLYNDVDVPFTPGTGFSIGTKTNNFNSNVLFRLPKADTDYTYYGSTENTTGGNETSLTNRDDNGRFVISPDKKGKTPVTEVQATGEMFGNPFMSHLDMKMFFAKNNVNENTYYILDGSTTITTVMGKDYNLSTEEDYNGQFVAPLQSFIVPDLPSATFNTEMIAKAPANGTNIGLRSATAASSEDPLPQLRITATRDGVRNTAVVAGLVTASDSYVEGEDAALLINEEVAAPQVYTLAGSQMTAINVTPELNEIPVGIHGKDATPVELSFKLSGAMKNVKLIDKQTGKRYDVTDGLTLTVPGNTSGRYFLNGSIATSNEIIAQGRIIFYNSAPGRIDISSVDPLNEVTVYDIAGRALRTLRNLNTPTAFVDHLAPGFYVVRAESGSQAVSDKVEVK